MDGWPPGLQADDARVHEMANRAVAALLIPDGSDPSCLLSQSIY